MNIEEYRDFCLSKPGVTESLPFDKKTLVFKVMGKMFALTGMDQFESINLKCNPESAIQLREQYEAVMPGYHMNKQHWNTVKVNADASDKQIKEWIDDSYDLIVQSLPKRVKIELANL